MGEEVVHMEEQQQEQVAEGQEAAEAAPTADDFRSEESKAAVLADLAKERDRRQSLEARLRELEQQQDEARKAAMSEQERALEEAVQAARAEERARFAAGRLQDRMVAKAARLFTDPTDAVRLLDTSGIDVDSAEADSEIEARLAALLDAKPYLGLSERAQSSGSGDAVSRPSQGTYQPTVGALLKAARGR